MGQVVKRDVNSHCVSLLITQDLLSSTVWSPNSMYGRHLRNELVHCDLINAKQNRVSKWMQKWHQCSSKEEDWDSNKAIVHKSTVIKWKVKELSRKV